MGTYEELFENNPDLENLTHIHFYIHGTREYTRNTDAEIYGNPADYLDVARKAKNLECIYLDPNKNVEFFKGLKEFVNEIDHDVELCPNNVERCTKSEFFKGENIIESVISEMDPNWNTKQKLAFVHYKMGELVTYHADYNSYSVPPMPESIPASKNIWKALNNRISICSGVVAIERTMLSRVGVKTQELKSGTHVFLLTETDEGNIMSDATWDLAYTKFGCRPQYLGLSYEKFREKDGGLTNAHKLDSVPENIITLSNDEVTDIYDSLGFLNSEKKFDTPIMKILSEIKEKYPDLNKRVSEAFTSFGEHFPNEMSSLSEIQHMMSYVAQWTGMNYDKLKSNYIYRSEDSEFKKPGLVFRIDGKDNNTFFKILDSGTSAFRDITEEELCDQYRLHINSKAVPFWSKNHEKDFAEPAIEENNRQK